MEKKEGILIGLLTRVSPRSYLFTLYVSPMFIDEAYRLKFVDAVNVSTKKEATMYAESMVAHVMDYFITSISIYERTSVKAL